MPDHKLCHLLADQESNVTTMATWPWAKTSRHLDLIDEQLGWAFQQRNDDAIAYLEEFRRQVVTARSQQLDEEE